MRLTAFIMASLRNTVRCSESISCSPNLRARRSAALRMPLRTKSGEVSSLFQASSLHVIVVCGASQIAFSASSSITVRPCSRANSSVSGFGLGRPRQPAGGHGARGLLKARLATHLAHHLPFELGEDFLSDLAVPQLAGFFLC